MGGGLSARLKRIQQSQRAHREATGSTEEEGPVSGIPNGWARAKPLLLFRETAYPIEFPASFDARPFLVKRIGLAVKNESGYPLLADTEVSAIRRERLVFIDIETTGLSTGAGTIAFAFGAGFFSGSSFIVRQIFLEDYPGEPEFIEQIQNMIPPDAVLVSYNGAAFDLGVLRTRCILSGTRFLEKPHIDLLRTSRRLWARPCGGASLSLIEGAVLGSPRDGDIPGAEAPERFFQFLRNADFSRIEPILDHHRLDIAALPRLLVAALGVFGSPLEAAGVDRARLGLILAALGGEEWEVLLKRSYAEGEEQAGKLLAQLYKKRGRWNDAVELWLGMPPSPRILRDLAITYERRFGNLCAAKRSCLRALGLDLGQEEREAFVKRLERLTTRMAKKNDKKRTISD
jgi:uncharacterized protein